MHQKRAEALRRRAAGAATAAGSTTRDGGPRTGTGAAALARAALTQLLLRTTAPTAITLALAAAHHLAVLHLGAQTHLVALLQPLAALVLLLGTHSVTALAVLLAAALIVLLLSSFLAAALVSGSPTLASAAAHNLAVLHLHRHDHLLALLKCPRALVLLLRTHCILLAALFLVTLFPTALRCRLGTIVRHCWFSCKRLKFQSLLLLKMLK